MSTKPLAELGCIVIFQFITWDKLGQLDLAVVTREFSAKRQEEFFKREVVAMLTPVHVENDGRLWGASSPIPTQFTATSCSHPLRYSRSGFLQEAPIVVAQVMVKDVLVSARPLVILAKAMDPMAPMPS